jgi:hypothetical protein
MLDYTVLEDPTVSTKAKLETLMRPLNTEDQGVRNSRQSFFDDNPLNFLNADIVFGATTTSSLEDLNDSIFGRCNT